MTWLNAHWTDILTVWGGVWALATVLQGSFPPGSVGYRVCHVILALNPGDFVKASKQLGSQLVPPTMALLLVFGLSTSACAPAKSAPATDPRVLARAAVSTLTDAWKVSAQACLDLANMQHDDSIRVKCEKLETPARQMLIAASDGVDMWTESDQRNFPCLITSAAASLEQVASMAGIKVPQLVADGLSLAQTWAGKCSP